MPAYLQQHLSPLGYELLTYLSLAALTGIVWAHIVGFIEDVADAVRRWLYSRHNTSITAAAPGQLPYLVEPGREKPHRVGEFGDLFRIADRYKDPEPSYSYVRPATREEYEAAGEAALYDGVGVFAIVTRSGDTTIETPDSVGWLGLTVHEYNRQVAYFVVRGGMSAEDEHGIDFSASVDVPQGWDKVEAGAEQNTAAVTA